MRIAFEQSNAFLRSASTSTFALLGTTVHRVIELSLTDTGLSLSAAWDQATEEMSSIGPDPRLAPGARRAQLRLERRFPELRAYIDARGPTELCLERELTAPDGSLTGRPDLLILGRVPAIVDYKTGLVAEGRQPHETYERQLRIYASLAESVLGIDVECAALFSLRQGIVEIDVAKILREATVEQVERAVVEFNVRVPGIQPATPSEMSCEWCPFVGLCDPAWEALDSGAVVGFGWGEAVRGVVSDPITISESGLAAVPVSVVIGTVRGATMIIDVPAAVTEGLVPGSKLSAWCLARRGEDPVALAWRDESSHLQVTPG
jgi:PD-(D/E)XK nuclease superfamily